MGRRRKMSVVSGVMENGDVRQLRPVSEMLTEYGLSMVNAVPNARNEERKTPTYPYERDLVDALREVVSSVDELRVVAALWIEATYPAIVRGKVEITNAADVIYVAFDPVTSFAKTLLMKDMMKRGVIVDGYTDTGWRDNQQQPPFLYQAIKLNDALYAHVAMLDQRMAMGQDAADNVVTNTFLEPAEALTVADLKLEHLKHYESGITLADHFLEPELLERIHTVAHAKNVNVQAAMNRMGVYMGPIKSDVTTDSSERNVIILHGPPGTGKTSAAYAIAGELGLPLLQLSIDDVLDCYWGQSEKNIRAAFAEYASAAEKLKVRPVLLLDECDSLLEKRKRTSGGPERGKSPMLNVVNIALQEIERFRGTLIMTTNSIDSIDTAFARRVDETIKLDYPSTDIQRAMWKRYLSADIPGAEHIDIEALLGAGTLTGALIVKVVQRAVKQLLIKYGNDMVLTTEQLLHEIDIELKSFDQDLRKKNCIVDTDNNEGDAIRRRGKLGFV